MVNNALVNTLLKSLMPTVRKIVEGGKIDALFRELKGRYNGFLHAEENSVEILVTTEEDGNEYVNVVEITPEMIHCSGCRIPGVKTPYSESLCPIRQCAEHSFPSSSGTGGSDP